MIHQKKNGKNVSPNGNEKGCEEGGVKIKRVHKHQGSDENTLKMRDKFIREKSLEQKRLPILFIPGLASTR